MSLQKKLLLSITLTLLFFGGMSVVWVFFSTRNVLIEKKEEKLRTLLNSETFQLAHVFESSQKLVSTIARQECVQTLFSVSDVSCQSEELLKILSGYNIGDEYSAIYLLDVSGTVLVSTEPTFLGKNYADRVYFSEALAGRTGIWHALGVTSGQMGYYFSEAVRNGTGESIGVAVIKLKPEIINSIIDFDAASGGKVMFVDRLGVVMYSNDAGRQYHSLGSLNEETKALLKKEQRYGNQEIQPLQYGFIQEKFSQDAGAQTSRFFDQEDNEEEIVGFQGITGTPFFLVIEKEYGMYVQDAFDVARSLSFFVVGVILATGILVYFLITLHLRPLIFLLAAIRKIEQLDFSIQLPERSFHGELKILAHSFNAMVKNVQKANQEIAKKVKEQTADIVEKSKKIEEQQRATLNILKDIEKEKKNAELLAKDLEKFKLAVEGASDHIVITDSDGIVIYANASVERITGFSRAEILGKKAGAKELWGGLMDLEFYKTMWWTIKDQKKPFMGDVQNHRKNGVIYQAYATISPIVDDDGEVLFFVGIERDISQEKEIDKAKTEFVSLASHQLRTPLSAIAWYAEMLLSGDAGAINSDQKQYLEEITRGNSRMTDLVNSLLNVSRIELGTFLIDPKPTDVADIVRKAVEEQYVTIQEKSLRLTLDIQEGLPEISVDQKLFWMIVQNLSSNAIKYTPEKGDITVTLRILPQGEFFGGRYLSQKSLCLSVADTGYGIPLNQQEKIFSKLFRADNVLTKDTDGTGLGLYLIKSIVNNGGGEVWFQSEEDKGSTFFVIFPKTGMLKRDGIKAIG